MGEDQGWFSRFAQPRLNGWGEISWQQRLVLPRRPDQAWSDDRLKRHATGSIDRDPGWQRPHRDEPIPLRLWRVWGAAALGHTRVMVIGDPASGPVAGKVKRWIGRDHPPAKSLGQPR